MGKAVCFGIACLDLLVPGLDPADFSKETIRVGDFSYSTGGDAINEAVTLAKLGHEPILMTVLADDAMGRVLTDLAEKVGVGMGAVKRSQTHQTAVSIVCVHPDGERNFIVNDGSDNEIGADTVDWEAAAKAQVFCVGSAYGAKGLTECLPEVLKKAKSLGLTTCVDIMIGSEYVGLESEADPGAFLQYDRRERPGCHGGETAGHGLRLRRLKGRRERLRAVSEGSERPAEDLRAGHPLRCGGYDRRRRQFPGRFYGGIAGRPGRRVLRETRDSDGFGFRALYRRGRFKEQGRSGGDPA